MKLTDLLLKIGQRGILARKIFHLNLSCLLYNVFIFKFCDDKQKKLDENWTKMKKIILRLEKSNIAFYKARNSVCMLFGGFWIFFR